MKFWQIVNDLVSNIDSIFIFLQTYTMKKSFFMPILVVIFISMTLGLGGCGSQQNLENPEKVENQENKVKDSDVTMNECMVWCETMWKMNEWNKWKPDSQMQKDCKNLCNSTQGIQNNNTDSCEESEWALKDLCYFGIAEDKEDLSICDNIVDKTTKTTCYVNIAKIKKDSSICERLPDDFLKDSCLDSAK